MSSQSPELKQVSTINNDIRIGRGSVSGKSVQSSSLSNSRNNRSPNPPTKRLSHELHTAPQSPEMSSERVFDLMEKEQDKIVVKMTREISHLQEEIKALRAQANPRSRRSSSISSNASLELPRGDALTSTLIRRLSSSSQSGQLPQNHVQDILHENALLKHENEVLRREIDSLKTAMRR